MVLDAYYPSDLRLEKEIPALQDAGIQVTLICYRRSGEAQEEMRDGLRIIRTKEVISHTRMGIADVLNALFFINFPIWRALQSPDAQFDAVHAHDLPVSNTALRWAKKKGIRSVLDLHENYPEALYIWFSWRKGPLINLKNKVFFNYKTWFRREREMVHRFDHVIAVIDEMKARLEQIHHVAPDKITVVSNTEPKFRHYGNDAVENNQDVKNIVYVGGIGPHRGLDVAIEAMVELRDLDKRIHLCIVGSGNADNIAHLKALAEQRGVTEHVSFLGQQPLAKAIGYMKNAFLNIIPHHKNTHTDNTIPHKLFQIMNSEYPLMVSSCDPLKRIVESENCGLVFEAGSARSFVDQVKWAIANDSELKSMAINGRSAVQNGRWNWECDSQTLVKLYAESH
jgi:glycosyltransferase involved in cell wall biosynthesis